MLDLFNFASILAGFLILIIGFGLHFIGQLISVLNWDLAVRMGMAEKGILREYLTYENAMALTDVAIGWIYLPIGIGLILGLGWSYNLAFIPGVIFIYHSISFFFWTGNQEREGNVYYTQTKRVSWFLLNFISGIIILIVALSPY
ncbi:MAG: hypothetical protein ACP5C3_09520 [Methanomicrobiales archaeon]